MKKWNSFLLLIYLSLFIDHAHAITSLLANNSLLTNFTQLVRAVERGDDVKAIIRLDRCQITDPTLQTQLVQNLDGASTRFNFTEYLHFRTRINDQLRDTVTTVSNKIFEYSPGVFLSASGRLNVFEDNTATLRVNFYNPALGTSLLIIDWLCDISNGNDENGLFLYNSP
ncbi:TPA: hypothetical protein JBE16_13870 [Legionella pneumophila subsp. pneumophila]|uniref:hypothetical protein n=1 Tax=Legionella sp. PATHC039 TaxID=2992042 RepID=UPI001A1CA7AC|nr:hypothetical protein [Legionella sp. PATHC039]MCW8394281.1 hypothetical protein [Legionella sp. PATHC039]HAT8860167.1 hypothetical protein [Legionella pneumophila subsp. pneumophila]HAT9651908.1 hypothetical protein [Legionella pneumophila subsp. pneumophila]HAT9921258.1 hypothetical protein [Legionella pneumophila subsp. pneumophila]